MTETTERARRFRDPGATLADLAAGDVLVVCAACGGCARVVAVAPPSGQAAPRSRRLVCARCGRSVDRAPDGTLWSLRQGRDPFYGTPLWLQEPCRGRTLWALHGAHLDLLGQHVAAQLRQRPPEPGARTSVLERLPAWVTASGHRADVLRALDRMRRRLPPG